MDELRQTMLYRLEGVRRSLIIIAAAWLGGFLACYASSEQLFSWLARPVHAALPPGSSLVFLDATEPFFTNLKLAAVAGLILTLPVTLWQGWRLFAPPGYVRQRLLALGFVIAAYLSFLAGAWTGFTWAFPTIMHVLVGMGASTGAAAKLSMGAYLGLAMTMLIAFGLICELPLVLTLAARFGLVDHHWLRRNRRYMVLVAFIFGGLITPGPDVLSQASIAIPFMLLYEVGIIGARLAGRSRAPTQAATPVAGI